MTDDDLSHESLRDSYQATRAPIRLKHRISQIELASSSARTQPRWQLATGALTIAALTLVLVLQGPDDTQQTAGPPTRLNASLGNIKKPPEPTGINADLGTMRVPLSITTPVPPRANSIDINDAEMKPISGLKSNKEHHHARS